MHEGKPCVKCGSTKRYANGRCGACERKYQAAYHATHKPVKLCIDCGLPKECQGQGSRGRCEACRKKHIAAHKAEYEKQHPRSVESIARTNRKWNDTKRRAWVAKNYERKLWYSAKTRSKKEGWQFDLSVEDIVIPETCPVLGIPLERIGGGKRRNPALASLDRIDSSKGYTRENVWVISWRANRLKSDGTLADFEALVRALRSHEEVHRAA